MDEFVYIEGYGHLMIDRIFFEANYPILFTCINENDDLFICVCCQNNREGQKWLIKKTAPYHIINLLQNKKSIRDIFLIGKDGRISLNYNSRGSAIVFDNEDDWKEDSIFLPKKGEYLDGEPGEFDEDIEYYGRKFQLLYAENYEQIAEMMSDTQRNIQAISEKTKAVLSEMSRFTVDTQIFEKFKMADINNAYMINEQISNMLENLKKVDFGFRSIGKLSFDYAGIDRWEQICSITWDGSEEMVGLQEFHGGDLNEAA